MSVVVAALELSSRKFTAFLAMSSIYCLTYLLGRSVRLSSHADIGCKFAISTYVVENSESDGDH